MSRRIGSRCEVCTGNRALQVIGNTNEQEAKDEKIIHVVCRRHKKEFIKKLEEEFPKIAEAETASAEEDDELREDL